MRTIKDVRSDLKVWGDFWARQDEGQGYASKSNVQALKETLMIGCAIQGTSHLVSHLADSIHVPNFVAELDKEIYCLSKECKVSLRQKYICRGQILFFHCAKTYLFWLRRAENSLL